MGGTVEITFHGLNYAKKSLDKPGSTRGGVRILS